MPIFFTEDQYRQLLALSEVLIPGDGEFPSAVQGGAPDYIDTLLGAFSFTPPKIWAGGPSSGRMGGGATFSSFHHLSALDELAWRTRIEGSCGIAEREFNGPVVGLQERYERGLAFLGDDFCHVDELEKKLRVEKTQTFATLVFHHLCEGLYGAPEYGGNKDLIAWRAIGFDGDVQPRGWSDQEVENPK